ncbi:MAG: CapA family protein [Marinilabiliaceae bacterium]|nr:CapA family protein [Marinilabiliaceae bacterium]
MQKNQSDTVKVLLTGDFCPINRIEELSLKGNYECIFNDFIDVLKRADYRIVDLECPLTNALNGRIKTGPYQKAHPKTIEALKYANVDLVAMSNNHIMDYDNAGIEDTLELCEKNNISFVGVGEGSIDASKPFIKIIGGKKIAVLNYSDNEFITTRDGAYCGNPIDPVNCFNDISAIRDECDIIIVIVHAGNEFYHLPSPRTKRLYRFIANVGADVVVSHHTHTFSGYEVYNGKPIFYGLGNFVYDWPGKINSNWNEGYTVELVISDKIDFNIIPLKQGNEKPGVFQLSETEKKEFYSKINSLSSIILNDDELEKHFQNYCKSVFPMYDAFIEPYFGKYITALQKRGFLPKLLSRKKRLLHLNLSRCESHRDVLLRLLRKFE